MHDILDCIHMLHTKSNEICMYAWTISPHMQVYYLIELFYVQTPSDQKMNVNSTGSVCQENFFADPDVNGGLCKPKCSTWLMYTRTTEIASLVVIGTATVIGILTTVVIIILSFVQFRSM